MKSPSLIRRLMFSVTAAVISFWVIAAVGGILVMHDEFSEIFDSALKETTERLAPLILDDIRHNNFSDEAIELENGSGSSSRQYLTYQARDASGKILVHSSNGIKVPFPAPLAEGFWQDANARYYTVVVADNTIFVQVADQMKNRWEATNEGALALLLPILILVPLSLYIIRLVARRSVNPIDHLRKLIAEKDSGDLTPIQAEGLAVELQPIVHSINTLMERVQSAFEAERAFTANSAHELRTPIAGALAHTQLLKTEVKSASNNNRIEQIESSLQKLKRLVEKLMQLARAEANIALADKPADLLGVLDHLVEEFQRQSSVSERIIYERHSQAHLFKPVNSDAFAIVLRNLIENALLHGTENEPVTIRVEKSGDIRIINGGKSLTVDELLNAQKRFGRGATTVPGSGLGIPIALEISHQMKAQLQFISPVTGRGDGFECYFTFNEL